MSEPEHPPHLLPFPSAGPPAAPLVRVFDVTMGPADYHRRLVVECTMPEALIDRVNVRVIQLHA